MNTAKGDVFNSEFIQWLSTYGSVTVQRIFDLLNFSLETTEIKEILSDKNSIYYHFLRVPFVNIFNNIIISQADGYREYIQKIFIDYLLSGAANEADAPVQGASIREDLEENRMIFMKMAEDFDIELFNQNTLIAESQIALIKLAKTKFKKIEEAQEIDKKELIELADSFESKGNQLTGVFRYFRRQFKDIIIKTQGLLEALPNYYLDEKQIAAYKEAIDFDTNIGEQTD